MVDRIRKEDLFSKKKFILEKKLKLFKKFTK